nr:GNAT family N-acetyltransferase [Salisediminibacterium selenitireducens]
MQVIIAKSDQQMKDVYKVRRTVFIEEQQVPESIEIDDKEEQSIHFLATDNGNPVGAGRLRIEGTKSKAERVCVLPDFRRSGVGALLMIEMERLSKKQGLKEIVLNAQTHAIPFYKRIGYEVTSELFYDAGIEHMSMSKSLDGD